LPWNLPWSLPGAGVVPGAFSEVFPGKTGWFCRQIISGAYIAPESVRID
jgi:hypothetical protein